MDWGAILIAALTSGALVKLLDVLASRKTVDAQANLVASEASKILLQEYKDRLLRLDERANEQDTKIESQRIRIGELIEQLNCMQDIIDAREDEIKSLENVRKVQQEEIDTLRREVEARDKKIAEQNITIQNLAARIAVLEAEINKLKAG